jgi:hypothetical protein
MVGWFGTTVRLVKVRVVLRNRSQDAADTFKMSDPGCLFIELIAAGVYGVVSL